MRVQIRIQGANPMRSGFRSCSGFVIKVGFRQSFVLRQWSSPAPRQVRDKINMYGIVKFSVSDPHWFQCGPGSTAFYLNAGPDRDPGSQPIWIRIQILLRFYRPRSYFRELKNNFLMQIGIRDPRWKKFGSGIREWKKFGSGIRDKHPGSATLYRGYTNIFCAVRWRAALWTWWTLEGGESSRLQHWSSQLGGWRPLGGASVVSPLTLSRRLGPSLSNHLWLRVQNSERRSYLRFEA